jgi:hypothetical protein
MRQRLLLLCLCSIAGCGGDDTFPIGGGVRVLDLSVPINNAGPGCTANVVPSTDCRAATSGQTQVCTDVDHASQLCWSCVSVSGSYEWVEIVQPTRNGVAPTCDPTGTPFGGGSCTTVGAAVGNPQHSVCCRCVAQGADPTWQCTDDINCDSVDGGT